MAQQEITGKRDLEYPVWHRRGNIARFVGIEKAQLLSMVDVDVALWVEYDDGNKEPLALIETARDVGQPYKPATVLRNLARRSNLPAFVVLYTVSPVRKSPDDERFYDLDGFRVCRLWPASDGVYQPMTPSQWAHALVDIRLNSAKAIDERREFNPTQKVIGGGVRT